MATPVSAKQNGLTGYPALLRQVRAALIQGQQRIEAEKVRTYWETGRLIQTHILKNKNRAEYGRELIVRLSRDIKLNERLLYRCLKFFQTYPTIKKVSTWTEFSWSHYRELMSIPDSKTRLQLEKKAAANAWSVDELAAQIKSKHPTFPTVTAKHPTQKLLTPLRGRLYTYKLVTRPMLGSSGKESGRLLIDLGFGIFRDADQKLLANFNEGDIIESASVASVPKPRSGVGLSHYRFSKTDRTAKDLYCYAAYIEKVIDADTLKVRFDLGFETWTRQTLRLRGVDAPEMDTQEGQGAKSFVQSYLKEAQLVIVHSSRSDKYDRYLADIFIPQSPENSPPLDGEGKGGVKETEIYLNNLLLEQGYAERVG